MNYGFSGETTASIMFIFGDGKDIQETFKYRTWREDIKKYINMFEDNIVVDYMSFQKKKKY